MFKRPGHFIKQYLLEHDAASIAEMHQAYVGDPQSPAPGSIRYENIQRKQRGKPSLRGPTYHSFYCYFRPLIYLGLVELVGEEPMQYPKGDPADLGFAVATEWRQGGVRRLWRLIQAGIADDVSWNDPYRAKYGSH